MSDRLRTNYKPTDKYPNLFHYNGILVISAGLEAKADSLSAGFTRFMTWETTLRRQSSSRISSKSSGHIDKQIIVESPASYELERMRSQEIDDRKAGVIWHIPDSGKLLSMVFFTGKIVPMMDNPTIAIHDRP